MKHCLFICFLFWSLTLSANVIHYTVDDQSIFPNPERGFTEELGGEKKISDSKNQVVKSEEDWFFDLEDPENADRQSQTLVVLMYYLYNYMSQDLSDKMLKGFDADMQILRNHGFKCVLRFAYDWKTNKDAELTQLKKHIAQLKPHLESNKDVIYVIEAGFVGRWGEWYYSEHYGKETQELTAERRQILEAILEACPKDRFMLVRYPLIKLTYLGDENPLTAEQAFSGTPRARIGHHNDAFLNDWGNDGTYGRNGEGPDDDPILRNYIAAETLYVPNGGETNVEEKESPGLPEQVYRKAEEEMSLYHWSFCGSTYSEDVTERWRKSGIFDNLNRKMGYRYQFLQASFPETVQAGGGMPLNLRLKNVGYAPLYNERKAYIVLKGAQNSEYRIQMSTDPRRWLPNGVETVIEETLTIPEEVPEGTYQLYLALPDIAPSLEADPRYSIRFANIGTWDETSGMNSLLTSVTIQHSQTALTPITNAPSPITNKIIKDNLLLILRGDKTYTLTGQEVR